jgi:two-component system, LytTR family, response regulator
MRIRTIIVDDNEVWRTTIESFIKMNELLELTGSFSSPLEAYPHIVDEKPDLIFSDIDMPEMNGIQFFKDVKRHPLLIFVTSHPAYALESYETNAIDFLVKPFTVERFFKAVEKARLMLKIVQAGQKGKEDLKVDDNFFFVRANNAFQKIIYDDILYIKSMENFVQIKTKTDTFTTLVSLKNMMLQLPKNKFMQVHRGYVVNIFEVTSIDKEQVFVGAQNVPLGDNYKDELINTLVEKKLVKR